MPYLKAHNKRKLHKQFHIDVGHWSCGGECFIAGLPKGDHLKSEYLQQKVLQLHRWTNKYKSLRKKNNVECQIKWLGKSIKINKVAIDLSYTVQ